MFGVPQIISEYAGSVVIREFLDSRLAIMNKIREIGSIAAEYLLIVHQIDVHFRRYFSKRAIERGMMFNEFIVGRIDYNVIVWFMSHVVQEIFFRGFKRLRSQYDSDAVWFCDVDESL